MSGTTPTCFGSRPKDTSSPSSPTDARSSRGPTTSPGHVRFTPSSSEAEWKLSLPEILPMIYLDNAATSFPKPEPVYQTLDRFARTQLANPGRAGHRMAVAAERTLDSV